MSRRLLVASVVVLLVGVVVLGWKLHEERSRPDGVEITIGGDGLSVRAK